MKKKILLSAVLALVLVCLFAIAVGATTYNYSDEDGNLLYSATAEFEVKNKYEIIRSENGSLAKTDADGNSLTWYVINDDNGTSVRNITVKSIKTADAGVITDGKFTFTGNVTADNVVSVNFFGMEIKTFDDALFMTTAKTTPSGSNSEYCQVANGKYLLFLYLPKTLTAIPEQFCYRTSVRVLEWEDNTVLYTQFPNKAFQFMANLKELIIPEGITTLKATKTSSADDQDFRDCWSITYLKFPSTVEVLPDNVFFRCTQFQTVVYGENMTKIGYLNSDFKNTGVKIVPLKHVYVPSGLDTTGGAKSQMFDSHRGIDKLFEDYRGSGVVFFVQGDLNYVTALQKTTDKNFSQRVAEIITYEQYLANQAKYDNYPADGSNNQRHHIIVYDVPACVAYGHKYVSSVTEPDCLTDGYTTHTCSVCNDTYVDTKVDALGHSMSGWTLTTAPVYGKVGQETNECANCDYFEVRDYIAAAAIGNTYYASFEAALANAKADDIIVLLEAVTVTESVEYTIPAGITIESAGDAFVVTNGATLTLNGNFTVNAGTAGVGSWCAVWADGGYAVINGGTYSVGGDSSTSDFTHQNDLIYTKNGGTVTINGGTFVADNGVWALNENDKDRGTITVYGGTFVGFNPANNVSEGPNTSFLADGLHATANGNVYTVEAHSFDTVSSIAYANGYGKAGVKVLECACGETKEESVDALFMVLGYSASEAELGGITVGYKMNNEAIAEYEEFTGTELVYGVFAAASEVIGNNDIFDANGNTVSGVISKETSSMELEALNLKLVGFNTEELMAAEIVMGMYVNDGARVSYVQPEAPISGNKYHTVSYSKLPKEEE